MPFLRRLAVCFTGSLPNVMGLPPKPHAQLSIRIVFIGHGVQNDNSVMIAYMETVVQYLDIKCRDQNLITELREVNFATVMLRVSVVGLEVGFIYAYRKTWFQPEKR